MATATDTEQYAKELQTLTATLAKGPVELAKLPKELREPEFLEFAVSNGRILFGRPEHWWENAPGHAESASERPRRLHVDEKRINWTALDANHHKSVWELLQEEEETDAKLKLRVKLARRKSA